MSAGTTAMLAGVFGVPLLLLWLGHRLRRRSAAQRAVFWGMLTGYLLGACAALLAAMIPPAAWSADDTMRGLFGFWAMLIGPAAGGIAGMMLARRD